MPGRGQPPTDKGWAWVVLAASMGSHFLNGILVYSVGVLHAGLLDKFRDQSLTLVAMTGAVNTGLVCGAAPFAGYIINQFGCRTSCVLGGLLCFAGYTSTAFVTSVILLFFTFGLVTGVGLGLVYSATNITIGFSFERLRGVASGISNSFQAVGILCGSVIFQALIDTFSVSGTFLLLGAASLHFCFFGMFFRPTIYEGRPMELVVPQPDDKVTTSSHPAVADATPTLSHTFQNDGVLKACDSEEESKRLLPTREEAEAVVDPVDGKSSLSSGSHAVHDLTPGSPNTEDTSVKTTETNCVDREEELDKDPFAPTKPFETQTANGYSALTQADHLEPKSVEKNEERTSDLTNQAVGRVPQPNIDELVEKGTAETEIFPNSLVPDPEYTRKCTPDESRKRLFTEKHRTPPETDASSQEGDRWVIPDPVPTPEEPDRGWKGGGGGKRRWACCGSYMDLLTDTAFVLHCAALFVSNVHIGGVFLHLPKYVQQHGTSPFEAAELLVAVGCTSLVSKLSCGFALADPDIDPLILSLGLMGLNGIVTGLFPLYADSYAKQVLFSSLFGLYFGGLYAISNPILVRFAGVARLADAYGISMFILGVGYLMGPTLAAMIVDGGGTYGHSFLFLGLMMLSGAILDMAAACFLWSREKREVARQNTDWSEEERVVLKTNQSQADEFGDEKDADGLVVGASDGSTV